MNDLLKQLAQLLPPECQARIITVDDREFFAFGVWQDGDRVLWQGRAEIHPHAEHGWLDIFNGGGIVMLLDFFEERGYVVQDFVLDDTRRDLRLRNESDTIFVSGSTRTETVVRAAIEVCTRQNSNTGIDKE